MSLNIQGCLKRHKRKKINCFDLDDGTQATDRQARDHLNSELAKGNKLMPMGDCYRFDAKEKGCLGHIKALLPNEEEEQKIELQYLLFKQGKRI